MFKNYLLISLRNLKKNKVYSLINILGLAIAMSATILILLFVNYELSYDKFHKKAKNIYRLNEVQTFKTTSSQNVALSMYPMGPALKNDYPEVKEYVRFLRGPKILRKDDTFISVNKTFSVDPSILEVFDFEIINGNKNSALDQPNSVILTKSTALKLFGKTDIIGEFIEVDTLYQVSGIMKDIPENSHLQFDALFSMLGSEEEWMRNTWDSNFIVTYLLLENNTNVEILESKLPNFLTKYIGKRATDYFKLFLQPCLDVHLGSGNIEHDYHNYKKFDIESIRTFVMLAFFILLIACINFMNISIAQSAVRTKEVGVRKTLGAFRHQITNQFIGESITSTAISFLLSIIITYITLPYLNELIGRSISFSFFNNSANIAFIIIAVVVIGILSGYYPALILSAFNPVKALKRKIHSPGKIFSLRNFLVISQFGIAIALMIATSIAIDQLNFIQNKNIGLNKDQVLMVSMNDKVNEKYDLLKEEMLKNPDVIDVTISSQRMGNNIHQQLIKYLDGGEEQGIVISNLSVDYNFISFYDIELVEGREFSKELSTDLGNAYIINETLQKKLGWKNALGKNIRVNWQPEMGKVIGVAKDFNFNSLHHKVEPLLMSVQQSDANDLAVKVNSANISGAISQIKNTWETLINDRPFEYTFLDEHFESMYESDKNTGMVVSIIAGLSIFIACFGLFGLSSIIIEQRTKEIGIRKVMGASILQLFVLLSSGFLKLVIIAFFISVPATYYFISGWLQNFAYRIAIDVFQFFIAGFMAVMIALITISYRATKAAKSNPIKALKYE